MPKDAKEDAAATVEYPHEEQPEPGTAIEVRPGIFWLATPLPFKLRAINLWALRDGDGWTLVDAGYHSDATHDQWMMVWKDFLDSRPIKRLIITHFHPDHMGSSGWMEHTWDVRPYMTQTEWMAANLAMRGLGSDNVDARSAFYRRHGLDEERLEVYRSGTVRYGKGVTLPESYQRIRSGDVITIDGHNWHVVVGEGHSPEHACLHCPELNVIISGDQVLAKITPNVSAWYFEPESNQLRGFLETKERLKGIVAADAYVLPAHKLPFIGAHARLEELVEHHRDRLDKIVDIVEGETSAGEVSSALFPFELDGHQMGFAMGETIAHLNYLVADGRLNRVNHKDGRVRFTKTN